jgi:hypothetical protein
MNIAYERPNSTENTLDTKWDQKQSFCYPGCLISKSQYSRAQYKIHTLFSFHSSEYPKLLQAMTCNWPISSSDHCLSSGNVNTMSNTITTMLTHDNPILSPSLLCKVMPAYNYRPWHGPHSLSPVMVVINQTNKSPPPCRSQRPLA